jgi:hypothetical protein
VSNLTRAAKFASFWLILPKLTVIMLSKASIGLVMMLPLNPVAFGEILDSSGIFLVLFMVLENIFGTAP